MWKVCITAQTIPSSSMQSCTGEKRWIMSSVFEVLGALSLWSFPQHWFVVLWRMLYCRIILFFVSEMIRKTDWERDETTSACIRFMKAVVNVDLVRQRHLISFLWKRYIHSIKLISCKLHHSTLPSLVNVIFIHHHVIFWCRIYGNSHFIFHFSKKEGYFPIKLLPFIFVLYCIFCLRMHNGPWKVNKSAYLLSQLVGLFVLLLLLSIAWI